MTSNKRWLIGVGGGLAVLAVAASAAGQLSEVDVAAAIAEGAKLKQQTHKIGFTHRGAPGGYHILAYGPLGRIALASADAAVEFKTFSPGDVTPALSASTLTVRAEPVAPSSGIITRPLRALVIRAKGSETVIQPTSLDREPRQWSNALGGQFSGEAATSTFDLAAIPAGEFEILTVGDRGTDSVTVKEKDRPKLR
jgi:hypothetical protein